MDRRKYAARQIGSAVAILATGAGVLFVLAWWTFLVLIASSDCPFTSPAETPGCDENKYPVRRASLIATGVTGNIALVLAYISGLVYLARRRGGALLAVASLLAVGCALYWIGLWIAVT